MDVALVLSQCKQTGHVSNISANIKERKVMFDYKKERSIPYVMNI